jgi:hypothetical protein
MNKYSIKIEITAVIEAFNEDDARDYVNEIFGTDEEVQSVKIASIKEKK